MPTTRKFREILCSNGPEAVIARELHKSASYRFRVSEDSINVEDLLEHLYELQLMLWVAQNSELPVLLPGFTANAPALQAASDALHRLLATIFEQLHSTCGDCAGEDVHALWHPILDTTARHQPVVPIFTLNYDWSFEKLAIEKMKEYRLSDGFELLGGTWDSQRLTALKPVSSRINIALAKLHGSTNWLPGGPLKSLGSFSADSGYGSDEPSHQFEIVYPGHMHEKWLGKESWRPIHGPDGMFGQWIEQEPYATLHSLLGQVLETARLVIVIGYAFHDQNVNEYLQEALAKNAELRVFVVDPGSPFGSVQMPPFHWLTFGNLTFGDLETDWTRFEWFQGCFGTAEATVAILQEVESAGEMC